MKAVLSDLPSEDLHLIIIIAMLSNKCGACHLAFSDGPAFLIQTPRAVTHTSRLQNSTGSLRR